MKHSICLGIIIFYISGCQRPDTSHVDRNVHITASVLAGLTALSTFDSFSEESWKSYLELWYELIPYSDLVTSSDDIISLNPCFNDWATFGNRRLSGTIEPALVLRLRVNQHTINYFRIDVMPNLKIQATEIFEQQFHDIAEKFFISTDQKWIPVIDYDGAQRYIKSTRSNDVDR